MNNEGSMFIKPPRAQAHNLRALLPQASIASVADGTLGGVGHDGTLSATAFHANMNFFVTKPAAMTPKLGTISMTDVI